MNDHVDYIGILLLKNSDPLRILRVNILQSKELLSKGFTRCDLSVRFVGHDKSGSESVYGQCKHCTCIFYSQNFFIKHFGKQNGRG